jgi:hypothetical protein
MKTEGMRGRVYRARTRRSSEESFHRFDFEIDPDAVYTDVGTSRRKKERL